MIYSGGHAGFVDCIINKNEADWVGSILNLPGTFFQRPAGTLRTRFYLQSGGFFIRFNFEANFQNCEIKLNRATSNVSYLQPNFCTFPALFIQRPKKYTPHNARRRRAAALH